MLEIPDYWRSPLYESLVGGFSNAGAMCLSLDDAKRIIHNQAMCDTYRQDMVDLLDAISK